MSLLLLVVSFILSGLTAVSNRLLIGWDLGDYVSIYSLASLVAGLIISLITCVVTRHEVRRKDAALGVVMGTNGVIATVLFLIALTGINGIVAFPVRACSNIALTAAASYLLWRERVTRLQWVGVGCAIAAIWLLVGGR